MMTRDYRKGHKSRLRLNAKRRVKKHFPLKMTAQESNSKSTEIIDSTQQSTTEIEVDMPIVGYDIPHTSRTQQTENHFPGNVQESSGSKENLEGRRIVDIQFFFKSLIEACNHAPQFDCSIKNLQFIKEVRSGFISNLHFQCNMCNQLIQIHTSADTHDDVNADAVLAMMNVGSGFTHLQQITTALEIPCMSNKLYSKYHDIISDEWEISSLQVMKEAAEEEKKIAINERNVDENGRAMITVVADGSWAKRSYHTNYSSLSGAAAIIGFKTKKVLFVGVRNKYCTICHLAQINDTLPKTHKCYKNWSGSSASMEADIIAEGFVKSVEMYNIIYNKLIADGDSSCYKKILDRNPYENIRVQKIECKNHLLRNYSRKIRDLVKDTHAGPLILRKKIQQNEIRLRGAINRAILYRKKENVPISQRIEHLKGDIDNSLSHVFGEHKMCQEIGYFCNEPFAAEGTVLSDLKLTSLYEQLTIFKNVLTKHAGSLIYDVDNNTVETFNSVIAKYIGGKRINFCKRRSYQSRCAAAVVSFNTKRPIYTMKRSLKSGISPVKYGFQSELKRKNQNLKRKLKPRKLNFSNNQNKENLRYYGQNCEKPDMDVGEFEKAKEEFLFKLKKNVDELREIEIQTRTQAESNVWHLERRKRLTASKFGEVCKKREKTSCRILVENIVYPKEFSSAACEYGRKFEKTAKAVLEKALGQDINCCGLYIDPDNPFLAASPDGIIGEKGIVEIKCPWSARNFTPQDGILNKKIRFWNKNEVNKNHNWFYQIQGQLHITRRDYCVLIVWTPLGHRIETIFVDDDFWKNKMEQKLFEFYYNCILPELVDPRQSRNMPLRDSK